MFPAITDLFSITRATVGTAVDTAGAISSFASGVMRRTDKGILVEEARTNFVLQSEALDTTWSATSTTLDAGGNTAPDGTSTAFDLNHDDSSSALNQTLTLTDNKTYAVSAFVKQGTTGSHDWVKLAWMDNSDADNGFEVWFDLVTGTLGTVQASGTGTLVAESGFVEEFQNGWYRFGAAGQVVSGQTDGRIELINTTTDAVDTAEATNSVFWWGIQAELAGTSSVEFPLSYIPTTTVAVTRNRDDTTFGDVSFIPDTLEGTLFVEAEGRPGAILMPSDTNGVVFRDSTSGTRFEQVKLDDGTNNTNSSVGAYRNSSNQIIKTGKGIERGLVGRFAISAKTNSGSFADDGTTSTVDTSITLFAFTGTKIGDLGFASTPTHANLYIRKTVYWVAAKSQTDTADETLLTPAWALRAGEGRGPVWDADFAGSLFWVGNTEYTTVPTFFTAIGATFTRASSATFVGSDGLIQTEASNDVARLTYSAVATPVSLGLLREEARTNSIIQSEDYDTTWVANNAPIITVNSTVAPDGNTTADTIEDNDEDDWESLASNSITVSDSQEWTLSQFFKKDAVAATDRFPAFEIKFTGGTATTMVLGLDTADGSIGTKVDAGTGTILASGVEDHGDYWRPWIAVKNNATSNTALQIIFYPAFGANANKTSTTSEAGTVISWGTQVELGAFPTSYTKTTTTAVTRAAEVCVITKVNNGVQEPFAGWNTLSGTMYAKWVQGDVVDTTVKDVFVIQDADDDENESVLIRASADDVLAGTTAGATGSLITDSTVLALNTSVQAATSWLVNNTAAVVDGGTVGTDDTAVIPVCTRMFIGDSSGGDETLNAPISRLAYFNFNLTDADLDTLTGG